MKRFGWMLIVGMSAVTGLLTSACGGGGSNCGNCDDGIDCIVDSCNAVTKSCENVADHDLCTGDQICDPDEGCIAPPPCTTDAECDDGNPCTDDTCDPASGCTYADNTAACDDGDACTENDVCAGGTCGGEAVSCDDDNVCTDDTCDPAAGCQHDNNTAACDDGSVCTSDDVCADGTCGGVAVTCDDANPCTDDTCDAVDGCVFTNNTAACDDGDACTENDMCSDGTCGGEAADCDDGNVCTTDSCSPVDGCQHADNALDCDDGNACTDGDVCSGGACGGAAISCDDGNVCTDDACDPDTGCVFTDNTDPCDDGNDCTQDDACVDGACVGGTNTCECEQDSDCAGSEDGDLCNGTLHCVDNACLVDPATIVVCDASGDTTCQHNTCNPADGTCAMQNVNEGGACDDGDACTQTDVCMAGVCEGVGRICDDGNVCTDDNCDPATGCVFTNNTVACDDGSACTENDVCSDGVCGGSAVDCDDGNVCTTDSCAPATGCEHVDNTVACDDGSACTDNDVCSGGTCAGTAITCTDGNVCTDDACDPDTGCMFTDNTDACDDGVGCTDNDTCAGGVCAGTAVNANCADGNVCTDDVCDPFNDCQNPNNSVACDDADPCTLNDVCAGGTCTGDEICCDDTIDNDGDGSADCLDGDCALDPACNPCDGTLAEVRAAADGAIDPPICLQDVRVTYVRPVYGSGNGYYIQKEQTGPAVFVYLGAEAPTVEVGNTLRLSVNSVTEYNGLKEINGSLIEDNDGVAGSVADLVQDFTTGPALDEDAESELIRIDDAVVVSGSGNSWVIAYDDFAYQTTVYSSEWSTVSPCPGMRVSIQAPAGQYFASYQLTPYWPGDFLASDATGCSLSIDYCRLQWPPSIAGDAGDTADVYGRLYVAGLTDQSSGNDPWPSVIGQVGYGPDGSTADDSWTWIDALPTPGWDDSGDPNNDEYVGNLTLPAPAGSPYDYAFRFSGDSRASWTYCDLDGSSNGYDPAQAGDLQVTGGAAVNLFFSEYVEGSSYNKAVEIFNAGADPVDLSTCEVLIYSNGNVDPGTTIGLSGSLAAGAVYVVCDDSASQPLLDVCDLPSGGTFFNGDDAVELVCGGVTMDVIGEIGFDPGSAWIGSGAGASTQNNTLRRDCSVTQGDTVGDDPFDPDAEWLGVAIDTFDDLGLRNCP